MSGPSRLPYGGAGDSPAGGASLPDRFRRHADSLARSRRSPLYVRLMSAAADDIDRDGLVARLFEGISAPPGFVPQPRLMSALHYLVLSGQAPRLAAFYPSASGERPPAGPEVWSAALATIEAHFGAGQGPAASHPSRPTSPAARPCCSPGSCGSPTATDGRCACSRSGRAPA